MHSNQIGLKNPLIMNHDPIFLMSSIATLIHHTTLSDFQIDSPLTSL